MSSSLLDRTVTLRHTFRRLRLAASVDLVITLGFAPLLFLISLPAGIRLLFGLLITAFVFQKAFQFLQSWQALKQLRLEEQFIRHNLEASQLRQCVNRPQHLWKKSCVLRGLQTAFHQPLPGLRLVEEKQQHLQRHYHHAFDAVRPSPWNLGLLVLLFLVGGVLFTPLAVPATLAAKGVGLMVLSLLLSGGIQVVWQWQAYRYFVRLEHLLSDWTMAKKFEDMLRVRSQKSYVHTILYHARPWFSVLAAASSATEPLREVA